jgi:ATP-dependent Clp protease ATP-binding subunit ClpC
MVDPSTVAETIQILTNIRDRYEAFHKVSYSDEIIELCVKLADRYITDREFPDKAF